MKSIGATVSVISLLTIFVIVQPIYAEDFENVNEESYDFTVFDGEEIYSNPIAQEMLEKIEISWARLIDLQENKPIQTEQQKFIEAQRLIAEHKLETELKAMYEEYEEFTPRNAFAKFVDKKPEFLHGFYWELFNYLDQKVQLALIHKQRIIDAGGDPQDARMVFHKIAKFPKSELVEVFELAREKHGIGGSFAGDIKDRENYPTQALELYDSWMSDSTMFKFTKITEPTQ